MFQELEQLRKNKGYAIFALIDPDKKNDPYLKPIIKTINKGDFDAILVGGSSIEDDKIKDRIQYIKDNTKLPLILFPGSSNQITDNINAMLYLTLISGRNIKYLIEEHVESALAIKKLNLETIPTAYILLDGGNQTSVAKVSQTTPLSMDDYNNVLSHALAGQYLGNKLIYFDCGSGALNMMNTELLKYVSSNIDIPIIVGGGIKSKADAKYLIDNGASYIVMGTAIEEKTKE